MERVAVRSRDIAIIGYDEDQSVLEVTFRSGGVYHYREVEKAIFESLLKAPSQGNYFRENICDRFACEKISG